MRYLRKRGRPRLCHPDIDFGTKELQEKKRGHFTDEPLDICLKRGFITSDQHISGVHLRWLHTIRYGVVGVQAIDISNIGGIDRKHENPRWSKAREEEYQYALAGLRSIGLDKLTVNICVYNEYPRFLRLSHQKFFTIDDEISLRQLKRALNKLSVCRKGNK